MVDILSKSYIPSFVGQQEWYNLTMEIITTTIKASVGCNRHVVFTAYKATPPSFDGQVPFVFSLSALIVKFTFEPFTNRFIIKF